jgi:hypothetical protein
VTVDTTPPITIASLIGTLGTNGWYTSNVLVSLSATDSESGVHATHFSLDGTATTTGSSINIASEGIHTLAFYSNDNARNQEAPMAIVIKIDKTAPEAAISADLVTRDLSVVGTDNLSSTTITKIGSSTKIIDEASHSTTLTFQKTYAGKLLTYTRLASIRYDTNPPVALPSSLTYVWDSKQILVGQTLVVDKLFGLQALYDKKKDKTTIIILKKNTPIQKQSLAGLVLIKLTTNEGVVEYGW